MRTHLARRAVPARSSKSSVPADRPPELHDARVSEARLISPLDTVKLALLRAPGPDHDVSVFLEIWQPAGAQPPNSHPRSVETFLFLAGSGTAYCDDDVLDVVAGQLLVLPPRSVHRIENTGDSMLAAITTMAPDDGFAALVLAGRTVPLADEELALLGWARRREPPDR